jgi:DNA-binding XRE family transcriptional regulator
MGFCPTCWHGGHGDHQMGLLFYLARSSSVCVKRPSGLEKHMNVKNNLKDIRESKMIGKTELAKMAGISRLTVDRIEKGFPCRIVSQRKIILTLRLKLSQRRRVFRDS